LAAAVDGSHYLRKKVTMLLRRKAWFWVDASEPQSETVTIDAELRAYARSFAAPLVVLASLGAAFVLAVLLMQPA